MSKTLGQIVYEAILNTPGIFKHRTKSKWSNQSALVKTAHDNAASAVRKAALREAIEALREELQAVEDTVCLPAYRDGFADAFKALTRLMGDE